MHALAVFLRLFVCGTLTLAASTGGAAPDRSALAGVAIDELKAVYLSCDRLATTSMLDSGTAGVCSIYTEELLARGFKGDFTAMLNWWRSVPKNALPPPAQADR